MALTLLGPVKIPIKLDTVKSGWFIVYIEGSQVIISKISRNLMTLFTLKFDWLTAVNHTPVLY